MTHGYHLVEGKSGHAMEDYVLAEYKQVEDNELGLFAIFDGHLSRDIPIYLKSHLFNNILNEVNTKLFHIFIYECFKYNECIACGTSPTFGVPRRRLSGERIALQMRRYWRKLRI